MKETMFYTHIKQQVNWNICILLCAVYNTEISEFVGISKFWQ
jgi:hypothetical protein